MDDADLMKKTLSNCRNPRWLAFLAGWKWQFSIEQIGRQLIRLMPVVTAVLVLTTLAVFLTSGFAAGPQSKPAEPTAAPAAGIVTASLSLDLDVDGFDLYDAQKISRSKSVLETMAPAATPTAVPEPTPTAIPESTPYPRETDAKGNPQEGMPVENFTFDQTVFYVKVNQVNIREYPNTTADILGKVTMGYKLTRMAYGLDWSEVLSESGTRGYVLTSLITTEVVAKPTPTPTPKPTPKPTAKPTPKPTTKPTPIETAAPATEPSAEDPGSGLTAEQKQAIIDLAKSCLGVRYVYGSESMSGFDCTGFTCYIYKELFNITLPRSARDQAKAGKSVSLSNIQVGDIICFDWSSPRGACDHVGLYIGGGQYINASYSRGSVVTLTLKSTNPVMSVRRIIY